MALQVAIGPASPATSLEEAEAAEAFEAPEPMGTFYSATHKASSVATPRSCLPTQAGW